MTHFHSSRQALVRFAALAVTLPLIGCTSSAPMPDGWVAIDSARPINDCEPIAGTYSRYGSTVESTGMLWYEGTKTKVAHLDRVLELDWQLVGTTHVDVKFSSDESHIVFWAGSERLSARRLRTDEVKCESGSWKVELADRFTAGSAFFLDATMNFKSLHFLQGLDNSLIIQDRQKLVGTAMLLPMRITEHTWHRFMPATEREKDPGPNAPQGILTEHSGHSRLMPPANFTRREENHAAQSKCLTAAVDNLNRNGGNLDPADKIRIAERSTQALLGQWGHSADGAPYVRTEYLDRKRGHTPSTRGALLRKPHWLHPSISDRFVLCLLDIGYAWETVETRSE